MEFDPERVRENVRAATTEDLLDRVTVYRADLEPDALPIIYEELRERKVTAAEIVAHEEAGREVLFKPNGKAQLCARCMRPAVAREWGWRRLFGAVPLFPKAFFVCEEHRTGDEDGPAAAA